MRWSRLRRDDALPLRLLTLGLPLTMALGALAAWVLLPGFSVWELALVAVILAPTDAALGQPAIADPRVPATVRQGLNVESGLNDGIALPFFVLLLAGATGTPGARGPAEVFLLALVLSTAVGLAVGCWARGCSPGARARVGGRGVVAGAGARVRRPGLRDHRLPRRAAASSPPGWPASPSASSGAGRRPRRARRGRAGGRGGAAEEVGTLLAAVSFFVFGAVLLGPALSEVGWRAVLYARSA